MPVNSRHPSYDLWIADWTMMRDAVAGDRFVKERREVYLPKPSGFRANKTDGRWMYHDYLLRAQFPEIVAPTHRGFLGVIHRKEAKIELPKALEPMFEKATPDGAPLETLHKRITQELLITGRYALFADAPVAGSGDKNEGVPFIAGYDAEHLINWSRFGDFFVFDESSLARDGFVWTPYNKYRVLEYKPDPEEAAAAGNDPDALAALQKHYFVTVYDRTTDEAQAAVIRPTVRGGGEFEEIPCVVIGATDVKIDIDEIPLKGVARAAYSAFRLDADYRYQLYMSGQETFVMTKTEDDKRPRALGAGVVLTLQGDSEAKYVSPTCKGIEAHRTAIRDEFDTAAASGARLFDSKDRAAESGDALRIRFAGQTATVTSIALASAAGLEKVLRHCARMVGADPKSVTVAPNLSFVDTVLTAQDAVNLVTVWQKRAISGLTLYEALQRGEIANTERSYEEEQALIEDEVPPPSVTPIAPPAPTDQQINGFRNGPTKNPSGGPGRAAGDINGSQRGNDRSSQSVE